jgi:hypothetical protein
LIGVLIAWVRRNLTSHLREPYVDPTFQRQETFNCLVVETLQQLVAYRARGEQNGALAERVAHLEATIAVLTQALTLLASPAATPDQQAQWATDLRQQLDRLAATVKTPESETP